MVRRFIKFEFSLQCHRVPVAELLNCESNIECTQMQCENEMVFKIVNVTTGGDHGGVDEPEKDTVPNVGTISEELASIAHVKRIFVSRGIDSTGGFARLRQLQGELRTERKNGLAQTKIAQSFGRH